MENNIINLRTDNYIHQRAFCAVDAENSIKEQFLDRIGVEIDGKKVRVNPTLTANYILKYSCMILLTNNELAIYNGKFYEITLAPLIIKRIIKKLLNCIGPYWNTRREKEIIEAIKLSLDNQVKNLDIDNIINFRNGVLNLDDLTLHEHSPKYLCSYMLETEYDPNAKCPRWDAFVKEIFMGDESRIMLLQEVFGACISNARTQKAAIFYGSGANGKSVAASTLETLCGSGNVAHLSLDKFQSQFGLQSLIGKKLNVAAELETGNTKLITSNFKSIVGGDALQVNIKYQAPLETVLNCKLVFLTNNLPDTLDTSFGYIRRLLIIPFNYTVPEDRKDVYLPDKLKKEMGIGEVYKIHGSIDSPNSLVFTTEDYNAFENNLKVIAAKLLNLALEYPIIFIGYSLEDENILRIFETLISSLNEKQLSTLSENLIYVEWKAHEELLKESKKTINRLGKSLEMTCISTDNYFVLYKHIMKFVPAEKPERVRKYKKMIQELILNSNSGKATIIANEDLDKLKSDGKLVIAFGQQETFAHMGVVGIKTENIMSWVIEQKNDITENFANAIFEKFYLSTTVSSSFYIPMFYLCRFTSKYDNNEKLKTMSANLSSWVDKINRNQNIKTYDNAKEIYKDFENLSISALLHGIVKTYANGNITYSACLKVLTDLNDKQTLFKDTNFRKAITYLDMKK